MWGMIAFAAFALAIQSKVPVDAIVKSAVIASTTISLFALIPLRKQVQGKVLGVYRTAFSNQSLPHSFLVPLHAVAMIVALCFISAVFIPAVTITNATLRSLAEPQVLAWILGWFVAWKVVFNHRLAGVVTAIVSPVVASAIVIGTNFIEVTYSTLPLIWTFAAVVTFIASYRSNSIQVTSMKGISLIWIYVCALFSLTSFDHVARITAIASLATIAMVERTKFDCKRWTELAVVANLQALMFIVGCCGVQSWFDLALHTELWKTVLPYVSLGLATSAVSGTSADGMRKKLCVRQPVLRCVRHSSH